MCRMTWRAISARNEGSKCVSMTWRAVSGRPWSNSLEGEVTGVGGDTEHTDYMMMFAQNTRCSGRGFIFSPLAQLDDGRGLHSSTFRLNVSTFCGIRWVHDFPPVY